VANICRIVARTLKKDTSPFRKRTTHHLFVQHFRGKLPGEAAVDGAVGIASNPWMRPAGAARRSLLCPLRNSCHSPARNRSRNSPLLPGDDSHIRGEFFPGALQVKMTGGLERRRTTLRLPPAAARRGRRRAAGVPRGRQRRRWRRAVPRTPGGRLLYRSLVSKRQGLPTGRTAISAAHSTYSFQGAFK